MDPVSILTLVTFGITSSASLYKTIDSFKSRKQDIRCLKDEVGDLNIVLQALARNIEETTENFEILRLILERCSQACRDFEKEVLDKVGKTESRFNDVKAWARLQYLGSNIDDFRKLIGSYKATMTIALADANLRTMQVTKQVLEKYTEMTQDTTSDLEDQIVSLSDKLEVLQQQTLHTGSENFDHQARDGPGTVKQTLEQKASLEQCLIVCRQLLDHIELVKSSVLTNTGSTTNNTDGSCTTEKVDHLAPRLTADALQMCTHNINSAAQHLKDLREVYKTLDESDESRIMQQLDGARHCLNVIGQAQQHRVNVFENIITAEDCFQTVVSTIGDLIRANGLTIGARSVNIMGQMNDESLQKITYKVHMNIPEQTRPEDNGHPFEKRHGYGHTVQLSKP